jgi:spermidine synthase
MRALVLAFFFVSGICGLLYEVVWIRVAGTVIGNTTFAIGTVVGVFMGGLALGAWAGGRAADRRSGAALLRLYGALEGGIAISAAAVPFLLAASEPIFKLLWNSVGEITALYAALRVVLMGLVLMVPTTLMGATLPVLTRYLSDSSQAAAGEAGRAYAINTFGGVAGTLLSGLWLVPSLGLRATTWVAVGLNVAIAAAALALARGKSGAVEPALAPEPPPRRLALVVSALSGFASLVYEVAWTRSLVLSLGSTVYAFTLILTAFILGLAAGSAVSSRLLLRAKHPEAVLAGIQALIGISALVLLPFLGDLPIRMAPTAEQYHDRYNDLLVAQAKLIGVFVFIPTFLIGAVFPFTFRLASGAERGVGRSVAAVYSWNTVGSIAGSLAASFLLVPALGLAASIRIAATVNLAVAAGVLAAGGGGPRLRLAGLAPLIAAGVAWLLPSWDSKVLASGAYLYGQDYSRLADLLHVDLRTYLERDSKILAEYWDAYGLTTVHRSEDGNLSIRVNGKADASTGTSDMPTQRTVGHLGVIHHRSPRRALVIGLGSGVTLGAVACHPLERVDCVEISPAGVQAARFFADANWNVLADPRVRLVVGDGRNAVQFAKEPYDVIVSQPSNLWISGMSNLFTRDFFSIASSRLGPGGVFCQWVQAYRLPLEDFESILRTFFEVFPSGSLWEVSPGQDYILLGSREELPLPFAELEAKLKGPSVASPFDGLSVPDAAGLLGHFVAPAAQVRAATGTAAVLTDDLSSIEYSTSRAMFTRIQPRTIAWMDELRKPALDPARYPGMNSGIVEKSRDSRRRIASVVAYEGSHPPHEVLDYLASTVGNLGDDLPTREHFERFAYLVRLEARILRQTNRVAQAQKVLATVPQESKHYPDALFERALAAQAAGKAVEAERCVRELLSNHPASFGALCFQAQAAEGMQQFEEAVARWRKAAALRPDSDFAFAHLGSALVRLQRPEEARQACLRSLEIDPQNALARDVLERLGKR